MAQLFVTAYLWRERAQSCLSQVPIYYGAVEVAVVDSRNSKHGKAEPAWLI